MTHGVCKIIACYFVAMGLFQHPINAHFSSSLCSPKFLCSGWRLNATKTSICKNIVMHFSQKFSWVTKKLLCSQLKVLASCSIITAFCPTEFDRILSFYRHILTDNSTRPPFAAVNAVCSAILCRLLFVGHFKFSYWFRIITWLKKACFLNISRYPHQLVKSQNKREPPAIHIPAHNSFFQS